MDLSPHAHKGLSNGVASSSFQRRGVTRRTPSAGQLIARLHQSIHNADAVLRSSQERLPVAVSPKGRGQAKVHERASVQLPLLESEVDANARRRLLCFLHAVGGCAKSTPEVHSEQRSTFCDSQDEFQIAAEKSCSSILMSMHRHLPSSYKKVLSPPRIVTVVANQHAQRGWFDRGSDCVVLAWRPGAWTYEMLTSVVAHELFHAVHRRVLRKRLKPSLEEAEGAAVLFELWASAALHGDLQPGIDVALKSRALAGCPARAGAGSAAQCQPGRRQWGCSTCAGASASVYLRGAAVALCQVANLEALLNYPCRAQPQGQNDSPVVLGVDSAALLELFAAPLGTTPGEPAKATLSALLEHFGDPTPSASEPGTADAS